jgi:hypothetical protein
VGSGEDDAAVREIGAAILLHLRRHPRARDTSGGIAIFWLEPPADPELVERALESLVARGRLARTTRPSGATLYSLAPRRRARPPIP